MTFSLRAVAAVVVVAGIVVFTASVEREGEREKGAGRESVWLGGVCALNLAPNIKINNVCVRCVCGCVKGGGKGGAGGVSQHAIRISFKREHVAEILTPRFHLRNCANEPTAGRTHVSEGRRSRRGRKWRSTRRN